MVTLADLNMIKMILNVANSYIGASWEKNGLRLSTNFASVSIRQKMCLILFQNIHSIFNDDFKQG